MGGLPEVPLPKLSDEEVIASLIQIGQDAKVPDPHTVWVVEDPSGNFPFYKYRSDLDNICYPMPVSHFEKFPLSNLRLEHDHIVFYHYREYQAAMDDAVQRLARIGRRCAFCFGVVHPATGCQYSYNFIVCGTCIRPYQDVMGKVPKTGLSAYLENWTASKGAKKLKAKAIEAKYFYESAGKFLGQDNRKIQT